MSRLQSKSDVILNVYDTSFHNQWTYYFGWGRFHTGIEIYGKEYIYRVPDGITSIKSKSGGIKGKVALRTSIKIGETTKNRQDVQDVLDGLDNEFTPETYDPVSQNSNHFTDRVAGVLCHKTIPQWINLVADLAGFCHFYPKLKIFTPARKFTI